jgi:hypothetical protein
MREARARAEETGAEKKGGGKTGREKKSKGRGSGVLRTVLDMIHPPGGLHKEGKDARLTGMTRSLERRVLGLRVTDGNRGGEEQGKR